MPCARPTVLLRSLARLTPSALPSLATLTAVITLAALTGDLSAQTAEFAHFGKHVGDALGASVTAAGDVDGDTVPDVLVGAPAVAGAQSAPGYALVLSGADGHTLRRLFTTGTPDLFGWSVAGVGDTDGDDVPDLLVGQPGSTPSAGQARLFSGADGQLLAVLESSARDTWDGFGFALAGVGDLDGDGTPDFVVGQPSLSGEESGAVRAYSGGDGGLLYTLTGDAPGDRFGQAVASAGLIDDDAVQDLIVGAPDGAYTRVFSGVTGAQLYHFPGLAAGYGRCVAGIGDLNGDGTDDVAIGTPALDTVDVMSGATGLLLRRYDALGGAFGSSIAALGDIDGDAVPDLLIGSPDDTLLEVEGCGTALVVSGDTGASLYKFFGHEPNAHAGAAVASLGDTDGDGLPELLLGTPGDVVPGVGAAGSVAAYSGTLAASVLAYGFGCPNSFLITPRIEILGDPTPNGELLLSLTRLTPGSVAVVFTGTGQGFAPLINGCILWVAPLLPATLVFSLGDFPESADTVTVSGRLPPAVPPGAVITFQAFVNDPFGEGAFATSAAVQLTIQ